MTPNLLDIVDLKMHFPVGRRSLLHAVDEVNFEIGKGESVGLVGESGCGKSTLVRLITRMLDPTAGDIIFNGRNIGFIPARKFAETQFRPKIQMVFQDPSDSLNPRYTAYDTIAEPLRLLAGVKDPEALRGQVFRAAEQTGLPQELLMRFPHQLSGGQKARVGIARAIALRPELLILDEPTAALDTESERLVIEGLERLMHGRTVITIAHRLSTIRDANKIIVLDKGVVAEEGTNDELLARGGIYAELHRIQYEQGPASAAATPTNTQP